MWYGPWDGGGWLVGSLMMLGTLLFWAVLIALVIWAVRRFVPGGWTGAPSGTPPPGPPRAREVLDERFARGEIDEEEYRRRRTLLDERP